MSGAEVFAPAGNVLFDLHVWVAKPNNLYFAFVFDIHLKLFALSGCTHDLADSWVLWFFLSHHHTRRFGRVGQTL